MKTTNKIQKTALIAAAVIVLIIISFAGYAQYAMKSLFANNEDSHIIMAMGNTNYNSNTVNTSNFNNKNSFAAFLEEETEAPIIVEEWMIEESSFTNAFMIEDETENPLQIESWMTNEEIFDGNLLSMKIATDTPMNLEDWMIDENNFRNNEKENNRVISTETFVYREVNNEKKLVVEAWMVNPKIWRN